jgi:hypothetical protein
MILLEYELLRKWGFGEEEENEEEKEKEGNGEQITETERR